MKQIEGKVTVTVGTGNDAKDHTRPVSYQELESSKDVLDLMTNPDGSENTDKVKELLEAANYGLNLKARSKVRQDILNEIAGPDKAFDQTVKQIIKSRAAVGKPLSEDEAKKIARTILGLDAVVESAVEAAVTSAPPAA